MDSPKVFLDVLAFSRLNPAERVIYSFMLAHLPCLQACFSGDQVHASTLQTWIRDKTIFVTYGHYSMFSFSVSQIFPSVHSSVQLAVCCLRQLCGQTCPSTSGQLLLLVGSRPSKTNPLLLLLGDALPSHTLSQPPVPSLKPGAAGYNSLPPTLPSAQIGPPL